MATVEEIKQILKSEVNDRVDIDGMSVDASLSDSGVDSLDMSSVFMTIEDKFGISIPDVDLDKLTNIQAIVDYVNDKK